MKKLENNPKPHYKSIRLKGFDYTQAGAYFVTICTYKWVSLFGNIIDGEMVLNNLGKIVKDEIIKTSEIRDIIDIDKYVIMPNHVHLIIIINEGSRTARRAATIEHYGKPVANSIPTIIRSFKSAITRSIHLILGKNDQIIWQRNYYEHIIRNEHELNKIRRYIFNNPPKWEYDQENRNGLPIDEKKKFWTKFLNEFDYD